MIETKGHDRGKLFRWSFAFMPNAAHAAPHIGHLFHVAHVRYYYYVARSFLAEYSWPILLGWNVYFDCNPTQEIADRYLAMLDWLEWPAERIDCRDAWLKLSQGPVHALKTGGNHFINVLSRLPKEAPDGDPNRVLHKVLYWNETGVYWVIRGRDCMELSKEEGLSCGYLPFRLPTHIYHALLCDEQGEKIDCNLGSDPGYFIDDLIGKVPPEDVMSAVCRSIGHGNRMFNMVPGGAEGKVVSYIAGLQGHVPWYEHHNVQITPLIHADMIVRVPLNWRDYIEDKERRAPTEPVIDYGAVYGELCAKGAGESRLTVNAAHEVVRESKRVRAPGGYSPQNVLLEMDRRGLVKYDRDGHSVTLLAEAVDSNGYPTAGPDA